MKRIFLLIGFSITYSIIAQPIKLHPKNSHYFEFHGKPLILISSAEHYGALINQAFDFKKYLNVLADEGMNYTRVFAGTYLEAPEAFGIAFNTLGPTPENFVAPWLQTSEDGLFPGDKKYDLDRWNPHYFKRLAEFLEEAEKMSIIVEITLFCSIYTPQNWERSPFNPANNINGFPVIESTMVSTLENGKILGYQKDFVRKLVQELNAFDNVFYEIQNEPWYDQPDDGLLIFKTLIPDVPKGQKMSVLASNTSLQWQREMAAFISTVERKLPNKHLIAQNFCNMYYPLKEIDPNISILNFHYAWSEAVLQNYGWDLPISFDESGFSGRSGNGDTTYLRQAWEFILAGGAIFNNLDFSFYCGFEDGTLENKASGGGSKALRSQLSFLHSFIDSFDFLRMSPDMNVIYQAPGMRAQSLSERGSQYAIVFADMTNDWVKLKLPQGEYQYEFYSPFTGEIILEGTFESDGKISKWEIPGFDSTMVVLKIVK